MLSEINEVKNFLLGKFGSEKIVPEGLYAVPTNTSKGKAFLRVKIGSHGYMSDFSLWMDEKFTISWYAHKVITVKYTLLDYEVKNLITQVEKRHWDYYLVDETNIVLHIPEQSIERLFYVGHHVLSINEQGFKH